MRYFLQVIHALLLLSFGATAAFATTDRVPKLDTKWVLPLAKKGGWETRPLESTRPVLLGDILYAASLAGNLVAIHKDRGYALWEKKLGGPVQGALAYGRSKLFVGVGDKSGSLVALHARDGSEAWRFSTLTEWLSPPLVLKDRVVAVSGADEVYALSDTSGKELWHYARSGDEKMTVRGSSQLSTFGNDVFVGFADGYLVCLAADTGRPRWEKRLKTKERFYDVDAAPFVDTEDVIASSFDGRTYRLDRATGNILWIFPAGTFGGFLVENGVVYFAGLDGNLYAVDRVTGAEKWHTPYQGDVGSAPQSWNDYLVIATTGDPVIVVEKSTGKIVERQRLGAGTFAQLLAGEGGVFYALSNYGNLFSFQGRMAPKSAQAPLQPWAFVGSVRVPAGK